MSSNNRQTMPLRSPRETGDDKVRAAGKAIVESLIPGGSAITWLLDTIWKPGIQRRTAQWMEEVSLVLNRLNCTSEELSSNERFLSTLTTAAQLALQNHSSVKRAALRNAVVNSLPKPSYDESLQSLFLGYVDRLNDWHIRILNFLKDDNWMHVKKPLGEFGHGRSATLEIIQDHFDDLKGKEDLIELVLRDLTASGLIHTHWESVNEQPLRRAVSLPAISQLGKDFISFISE